MIGIFIEPNGKLKKYINNWKKKINKNFIKTKLTSHPPHSTIYYANLTNNKNIINNLKRILKKIDSFKIIINKTDIFYDDKLAGGDTLYLSIKKNTKLFHIQKKIADELKFHIKTSSYKNKNINLKNKVLMKSQKKYGYPFVGDHWMPHFTISSIKNKRNSPEFKQFIDEKIRFINKINSISVWKISGNRHVLIKKLKLRN
jgi:2'-5' RNA ligase